MVNSDYLYFCGIVVTSQTYAARVVHNNNKFDYIAVYKLYKLKDRYTISFEMLMCMTYTTSQDEKAILRILCVYELTIQVLRCLYM